MRRALVVLLLVAALMLAWGASANSAGAPGGAARTGCTCHSATPSAAVTVQLDGLGESFEPGRDYNLTFTVQGPAPLPVAQNQGGFQVIASRGEISIEGESTMQLLNETTVTHTSAGNDQRSWDFVWQAPAAASTSNVTFWFAGNAVSGDTTNQNDGWNRGVLQVAPPPRPMATPSNNTTDEGADSSGSAVATVVGAVLVSSMLMARTTRLRR